MLPVAPLLHTTATRLGFLLVDDFSMLSYASVIEPFRAANRLSGDTLYSWRHFAVNSDRATASSGVEIKVEACLSGDTAVDILFVCAGGNPTVFEDKAVFAALRRLASTGTLIAGVSGGPFILAKAGLLADYRCTIHWEHEPAFIEAFPNARTERALYVIDRSRLTCAGGTAGLDLAIAIIADAHGRALAAEVGDWFIRTEDRLGDGAQRIAIPLRYRVSHKGLVAALSAMEENLGEPLCREELAKIAGVSLRHLERLFSNNLGTSVGGHYLRLRLDNALRLLRETDLTRSEIAMASGFLNVSHFSRAFSRRFSVSPSQVRNRR